jgi:hypothetical protein
MIGHLDNLLRHLFLMQIPGLTDEAQVRFQPPDDDWRAYVAGLAVGGQPANALNAYLVELRDNRKLRSNERLRTIENDVASEERAPARVDCHYLITAWSPAAFNPALEPTVDEHLLLYRVLAALTRSAPINASRIYPAGSAALLAVPELIREADLPTQVAPPEGFAKLAEFWGAMGPNHRWKPAVHLVVTLPIAFTKEIAGPMVTTLVTEYRQCGRPETAEVWIKIGGHVLDATRNPPVPVAGAWVRLDTAAGEPLKTTRTNSAGRFIFDDLRPGAYQLEGRAAGFAPVVRAIQAPSPSGEYDLRLT